MFILTLYRLYHLINYSLCVIQFRNIVIFCNYIYTKVQYRIVIHCLYNLLNLQRGHFSWVGACTRFNKKRSYQTLKTFSTSFMLWSTLFLINEYPTLGYFVSFGIPQKPSSSVLIRCWCCLAGKYNVTNIKRRSIVSSYLVLKLFMQFLVAINKLLVYGFGHQWIYS